jgi:acetyltransferase-like isoleucine patch superfamily enzyme
MRLIIRPLGIAGSILLRGLQHLYTVYATGRFAACGRGSRIMFPATLVGPDLMTLGDQVVIREHAWFVARGSRSSARTPLVIGTGTYIGRFSQINAWRDVVIEEHVLIGDRVLITDADHNYTDPAVPIRLQGDAFKGSVCLRSGCWIGAGAVILPGVTIGRNAVVAANAVVTKDVADFTLVGGIPARVLRTINTSEPRLSQSLISKAGLEPQPDIKDGLRDHT